MTEKLNIRFVKGSQITEKTIGSFLPRGNIGMEEVRASVLEIIDNVRSGGNQSVKQYTEKFDDIDFSELPLRVTEEEIKEAFKVVDMEVIGALKKAIDNVRTFHSEQLQEEWFVETSPGVKAGQITRPISDVGLYIPGGKAVYPSSVIMTAIPAKVAGVDRLVICSPPQKDGGVSPAILVAAGLCDVDEIYRCGGAQAIAAMAYGTETIKPVKKIVGPGNKWVAAAKQMVSTTCGIDNPAGPSE